MMAPTAKPPKPKGIGKNANANVDLDRSQLPTTSPITIPSNRQIYFAGMRLRLGISIA